MTGFRVTDRRRVTATSSFPRPRSIPDPRPRVPYGPIKKIMERAWHQVSTHLRRGLESGTLPSPRWTYVWGLALSARQTYRAVTVLVADRQKPTTMPLQASILVRALLEVLGNLMALFDSPPAFDWFCADGHRSRTRQLRIQQELFGDRRDWQAWLAEMKRASDDVATHCRLTDEERSNPNRILEWPAPYWLTRERMPSRRNPGHPRLIGPQRSVAFDLAYKYWYGELSSYAHQRASAAQMAIFADSPDDHWEPGALESSVVLGALMFFAAILAELQVEIGAPPSLALRELWIALGQLDQLAEMLLHGRYRRLLQLPDPATSDQRIEPA